MDNLDHEATGDKVSRYAADKLPGLAKLAVTWATEGIKFIVGLISDMVRQALGKE